MKIQKNSFNWFPGHMAKALRQLKKLSSLANMLLIVLDARSPISSYNHNFDTICNDLPRLFLITKSDLGDSSKNEKIRQYFYSPQNKTLIVDLKKSSTKTKVLKAINQVLKSSQSALKNKRVFVVGPPNSGKSTLINLLKSRKSLKVGNQAGITRQNQWITVNEELQILDTPGILWPDYKNDEIWAKLLVINAIKEDILPLDSIYKACFKLMCKYSPKTIEEFGLKIVESDEEIYNSAFELAKNKKIYTKEGRLDTQKAMKFFIKCAKNTKGVCFESI